MKQQAAMVAAQPKKSVKKQNSKVKMTNADHYGH